MLKSLIGESPKQWDRVLAQSKFSYNDSPNKSTAMSPFQVLYGMHPIGVCEICDLGQLEKRSADGEEFATWINEIQEKVKARLQQSNTSYKARAYSKRREKNYEVGDFVDIIVTSECIHVYILCIVPRCLFQEVFIM